MTLLCLAATLLLSAGSAFAHGPEENVPARDLVQQAIAILRTQPEQKEAIADKIHDALDAKDATGVDLDLVRQAEETTDPHAKEDLLERAIGLSPHTLVTNPNDAPRQASSPGPEAPGHSVHITAYKGGPRVPRTRHEWAILAIAGLVGAAGFLLARRVS